ncbi:MAG: hypothetical protein IRZ16_00505 [Myxococcaceae bacterium]|nr:hypothetical protein [Myxococcaceae bacterium]
MKRERIAALVLTLAPLVALGQGSPQPVVIGASYIVNNGPGMQTDPHISGNLIAYTEANNTPNEIHYYNLATGIDTTIPSTGDRDYLSDISGTRIVFTRTTGFDSNVFLFDTATSTLTELDPGPGNVRWSASIGGETVAWEDLSVSGSTSTSEIFVYDIPTGTATSLTPGMILGNFQPAVSPDGKMVVFTACEADGMTCNIVVSQKSPGGWTNTTLTGDPARWESTPATDGELIVYESLPAGGTAPDTDLAFQFVDTPNETILSLPGKQSTPAVADGLIAFQSPGVGGVNDLFLYDVATGVLYQLTSTPQAEFLSDIEVAPDGLVTVTYVRDDGGLNDTNVFAMSFFIEDPGDTCDPDDGTTEPGDDGDGGDDHPGCGKDDEDHGYYGFGGHDHGHHWGGHWDYLWAHHWGYHWHHGHHGHSHHYGHHHHHGHHSHHGHGGGQPTPPPTDCSNPGNRPLLATLTVTRTHGAPNTASTTFSATPGNGLLCVTNSKATSGWVDLNGTQEVGPGSFKQWVSSIDRVVTLDATNTLDAKIAGKKGTSYTVTVYGSDPEQCETELPSIAATALHVKNVGDDDVHTIVGERYEVIASDEPIAIADLGADGISANRATPEMAGCAATGSGAGNGAVIVALVGLAGLIFRRRPAADPLRVHRR